MNSYTKIVSMRSDFPIATGESWTVLEDGRVCERWVVGLISTFKNVKEAAITVYKLF